MLENAPFFSLLLGLTPNWSQQLAVLSELGSAWGFLMLSHSHTCLERSQGKMCIPWGVVCVCLWLLAEIGWRKVYSAKGWTALVGRKLYWLPVVYLEVNHVCENSWKLLPSSWGINSFGHQGLTTSTYAWYLRLLLRPSSLPSPAAW